MVVNERRGVWANEVRGRAADARALILWACLAEEQSRLKDFMVLIIVIINE